MCRICVTIVLLVSLVPRLSPSTRAIYVRINNTREGKEGESLVVNRALPVRGQQLTRRACIIIAYVNCARGGGEPGNEANS